MRRSAVRLAAAAGSAAPRTTADYLGVLERHWSPAVPRAPKANNIVVDYARGCWITDMSGRKYLDFQTGIGVANTGHCHPRCVLSGGRRGVGLAANRGPVGVARAAVSCGVWEGGRVTRAASQSGSPSSRACVVA